MKGWIRLSDIARMWAKETDKYEDEICRALADFLEGRNMPSGAAWIVNTIGQRTRDVVTIEALVSYFRSGGDKNLRTKKSRRGGILPDDIMYQKFPDEDEHRYEKERWAVIIQRADGKWHKVEIRVAIDWLRSMFRDAGADVPRFLLGEFNSSDASLAEAGVVIREQLRDMGKRNGKQQTKKREPEWGKWQQLAREIRTELKKQNPRLVNNRSEVARRIKATLSLKDADRTIRFHINSVFEESI